ncbi:MAG: NYN domain-containing protein [Actinomycetaceae bacterium]|nr:NYN domain-containing protein [Actinomycetaceae bacterium]MDU0969887.1 NYN domain-containing protein [Actinomycetaceae bacterium]
MTDTARPTAADNQRKKLARVSRDRAVLVRRERVTAIFVDGGFYRRRAARLFGHKTPAQRADELLEYCRRHIRQAHGSLYRIFYYDCPPSDKVIYHPLTQRDVNLAKTDNYAWMNEFHKELLRRRKVALRRGENLQTQNGYQLKPRTLKKLLRGDIELDALTEDDFFLNITQKGVDMRLGLDVALLSQNHYVDQIIMIAGDSDFVPAAKHARRAGVDFILDPMWAHIADSLHEHVDGVFQCVNKMPDNERDPLHIGNMTKNADSTQEATVSDSYDI